MWFCVAGVRDSAPPLKVSKTWGFCSSFKNVGRRGTCEEDLQRCMSRGRCSTGDVFIRDANRSGWWEGLHFGVSYLQVCWDDFAWQWAGITFSWRPQYFRQMEWKNCKTQRYEAVSSALNFPFLKEVSENCFVLDAANFENWGSLAELFRFWNCQVQNLRKSPRILMLSSSKLEEVSQNSDVVKFKN